MGKYIHFISVCCRIFFHRHCPWLCRFTFQKLQHLLITSEKKTDLFLLYSFYSYRSFTENQWTRRAIRSSTLFRRPENMSEPERDFFPVHEVTFSF